jgi:hypothetical protein
MFSGELVRLIDLATQKHLQLSRAVFDTDPHQLAVIAALRQTLIATFNRYADLLGRLARHPQHELSWLTPGSMPLRLFQRVKLLNERVHHGVVQRLEDDPTLPDVPCGPDVDPAAAMGLLATARQALQRIEQILVQCSPADADDLAVDEALPPSLAAACRRLQSRLIQYRHDRLCRIQARQAEIRSLLGDVLAHGREVVQRFETLQLRSDAPTARRAAARSLKQFLDLLGRMTGPALRLPLDGGLPPGKRIYAPRVWQGIEAAPQFLLEVTVCNQVPNSIGLWIDSVLPHGFFADYHQAGEGETTHTYSFPFAVQFLPRLAGTSSFEIRRAVLRYEPTQWQTELTGWKAVMGNLHCPTEAVTVPVEELLIEESMDGDVDECDVPLARRAAG